MKRVLILFGMLLVVSSCGAGTWLIACPPLTPFLLPGAGNIQVDNTAVWEWEIQYDAPGAPYAWYWSLARILEAQHWTARNTWRPDESPTYNPIAPLWFEKEASVWIWDAVLLNPDKQAPNRARILVRRRFALR
jgi:hypothetical protein